MTFGMPDGIEHRDERHCRNGLGSHDLDYVDDAPNIGEPALAGEPGSELLSVNPMRSAGTDA